VTNIIVAYSKNRIIGNIGKIPWKIKEDVEFFKNQTMGHPVIMGRKTWDSISDKFRPLKGRLNIVVTHFQIDIVSCFSYLDHAIKYAQNYDKDIYIIGGASIYKQSLDMGIVDRIIASEIKIDYEGDSHFPKLDNQWKSKLVKSYEEFDVVEYTKVGVYL